MTKNQQKVFLIEKNQKEIIDELTNEEAGIIFKAIFEYVETKKTPNLEKTLKIVFKQFKQRLDFFEEKYEQKCLKNKENIEKYWREKKEKKDDTNVYERIQSNTNVYKIKEKEKEKIKEKIKIKSKREEKEKKEKDELSLFPPPPPSLQEIILFGESLNVDEEYCKNFFDYYEDAGWLNANNEKIKNWKLVFRNWVRKDISKGKVNKLPKWWGKENEKKQATQEEVEEMKKLLEGYE